MQLSFRKLRELHAVTDEEDDAQAQDFVETRLTDQVPSPPCGAAGLCFWSLRVYALVSSRQVSAMLYLRSLC